MRRRPRTKKEWLRTLFECSTVSCWLPFVMGYWVLEKARDSSAYANYKQKRAAEPPKPKRRKRALSIGSFGDGPKLRKTQLTHEQTQSGLFKLPIELRTAIYEEVVGRDAIHIILLDGRLCSYPYLGSDAHVRVPHARGHWLSSYQDQTKTGKSVVQPGIGLMGFLQSCRRVYTEMITMVYARPRFVFGDPSSFFAFVATILPQRFHSIRSVHIDHRCGDRTSPLLSFSSDLDYQAIRHLNILASPFPKPNENPATMRLLRLVCEILCDMKALTELRMDFLYQKLRERRGAVSTVENVLVILAMLEKRKFKTLDISFEDIPPNAATWIDLPYVRLRSQPLGEAAAIK